jgi:hypothetical protein
MRRPWAYSRFAVSAAAAAAALALPLLPSAPAAAVVRHQPRSRTAKLTVKYPVTGSTYLAAPGATVPLGPGSLRATVNLTTRRLRARLALPPATVSFSELGFIPVTATTTFIQDGATTGRVNINAGRVRSTSKVTLRITAMTVAGIPLPVPDRCQSSSPAVIKLASQPGFSLSKGGTLAGTYTLPPFAGCGLLTSLINSTTTGPGNTIALTLGQAQPA